MLLDGLHLEIIIGLGIPGLGAMGFIIRHFWLKTKCFYLMKQRLEQIEHNINEIKTDIDLEIKNAREIHIKLFEKMNDVEKAYATLEGKIDVLIQRKK